MGVRNLDTIEPLRPMTEGTVITVDELQPPFGSRQLRCVKLQQRNWSRVGIGVEVGGNNGEDGDRYFLKQYVDKAGNAHPKHFRFEQAGSLLAAQVLSEVVDVPGLKFTDRERLINVFSFRRMVSIDRVLRLDSAALDRCFPEIIKRLTAMLEAMNTAPSKLNGHNLPVKKRSYGRSELALNFKGFEIRNVGVPLDVDNQPIPERLAVFDFVRPYLAPVEEAAAKLFVSIGLLNWGKPVTRFLRGPNTDLMDAARAWLSPYLDSEAIRAELRIQRSFRSSEFHGQTPLERAIKRIGVATLGQWYLHRLERWCARNIG